MIKTNEIFIRKMTEDDYELLTTWLNNNDVLEYYGDKNNPYDLDRVIEKYKPRVKGLHKVKPCIVEVKDIPIGFMQFYRIESDQLKEFGYEVDKIVFGMDQFIGESTLLSKGYGTKMVSALVDYIQNEHGAESIIMDPHFNNIRAIKCYEKCGFVKTDIIQEEYWLMEYIVNKIY